MNIEKMSTEELKKLRNQIDTEIADRRSAEIANFRSEIEKRAASMGFSLSEIMSAKAAPKPAPYAHPKDSTLVWGGKGMKPAWLKTYLQEGGKLEDCKVG